MGINVLARNCCLYDNNPSDKQVTAPNPDPLDFQILDSFQYGKSCLVKVNYPSCTNYEGLKLLVFKDTHITDITQANRLDPHFDDDDDCNTLSPFARFEPTQAGWTYAIKLLEIMENY